MTVDLEQYKKLFIHRSDVFAEQQSNGAYYPVRRPITDDEITEHLAGMASYGTYVIRPSDQTVSSVVFDLDTHDRKATEALTHHVERFIATAAPDLSQEHPECYFHRKALLLETSGNKGVHVWMFLSEPVPARQIRHWVSERFLPLWESLGITLEIFPKQDSVEEGGYGNLVKLPLGVHAVSGKRSEILGYQGWASQIDEVVPLDVGLIPEAPAQPARASSEPRQTGSGSRTTRADTSAGPASPFPCVDLIQNDGVGQGYRDQAMFHLALYYYGHGIPEDVAEELCLRSNQNFSPPMGEADVKDKVKSAYRGRYQSARCGTDFLKEICPGPCKGGWSVAKAAESALKGAGEGDAVEVEIVKKISAGGRTRLTLAHPDAANTPTLILK